MAVTVRKIEALEGAELQEVSVKVEKHFHSLLEEF
jgi:hypothetical protein